MGRLLRLLCTLVRVWVRNPAPPAGHSRSAGIPTRCSGCLGNNILRVLNRKRPVGLAGAARSRHGPPGGYPPANLEAEVPDHRGGARPHRLRLCVPAPPSHTAGLLGRYAIRAQLAWVARSSGPPAGNLPRPVQPHGWAGGRPWRAVRQCGSPAAQLLFRQSDLVISGSGVHACCSGSASSARHACLLACPARCPRPAHPGPTATHARPPCRC